MDYESRVKAAVAQLDNVYKPQSDFYNSQIASLPQLEQQQTSALDQARVNAFRNIETTANSRGMFFSGQPISKQIDYNFGTYDPALANIKTNSANKKMSLEQQLISLGMQKDSQARSFVSSQIKAEEAARQKEIDRQLAERRHQETLAASYARANASAAAKLASQFTVKQKDNGAGYMFSGPNNRPISMAQYAQATGTDMQSLLKNSASAYDKQAYNYIQTMKKSGFTEDQMLARMQQKYPALF